MSTCVKLLSLSTDYVSCSQLSNFYTSLVVRVERQMIDKGEAGLMKPFLLQLPDQCVTQWVRLVLRVLRSTRSS